jgi:hypothetical protein
MATTPAPSRPSFSDEQFAEFARLIKDSDSVELKLTVPETAQRFAINSLGMDPLDGQIRQVFFFDTPDLALDSAGVVVRTRRIQNKGDDSVIKLRPVVPSELPGAVRKSAAFGVEVDATPGGFVCSGSMKQLLAPGSVKDTLAGGRSIAKLFSKEQRALFEEHAPDGIALKDLAMLGPIFVLKLKFTPGGLTRKIVAEMWLYPNDHWILELSTKCTPNEAFQVAGEMRVFLTERGVHIGGEQQTKTRTALEFFSQKLKSESAPKKAATTRKASPARKPATKPATP